MNKTVDEKYDPIIKRMCSDMVKDGLKMMTWTYPNGWTFKLSIPQKKFTALQKIRGVKQ